MPIHEFKCTSCEHVFEELILRSSDKDELECPECGTPRVDQLMSSFSCGSSSPGGGGHVHGAGCGQGGGFS